MPSTQVSLPLLTRIFLVDDHLAFRQELTLLLQQITSLQVVGQVNTCRELLDELLDTPTDLVILAASPAAECLATVPRLRRAYPRLRVLMLASQTQPDFIREVLAAGAHGYALKDFSVSELLTAVTLISAGRRFLCAELGLSLLERAEDRADSTLPPGDAIRFSPRELEVLTLLTQGLTTTEIASQLFTSKRTVETHRQHMLEKAQTRNTASLIFYAFTRGYLNLPRTP